MRNSNSYEGGISKTENSKKNLERNPNEPEKGYITWRHNHEMIRASEARINGDGDEEENDYHFGRARRSTAGERNLL